MSDDQNDSTATKVPTPLDLFGPDLYPSFMEILEKLYDHSDHDRSYKIESNYGVLTFTRWPSS